MSNIGSAARAAQAVGITASAFAAGEPLVYSPMKNATVMIEVDFKL